MANLQPTAIHISLVAYCKEGSGGVQLFHPRATVPQSSQVARPLGAPDVHWRSTE